MSKRFLIINIILALPINILAMDNRIVPNPTDLKNRNVNRLDLSAINSNAHKSYHHETTPRMVTSKNTPSKDAVKFNSRINKFGKASLEKNEKQQKALYKKINAILLNENKLNGYYPAFILKDLQFSTIQNNTPLQTPTHFAHYFINPINKSAYIAFCEYMTRNKPLHRHILAIQYHTEK